MSDTNFVQYQTVIEADWLNDTNDLVYNGVFPATSVPNPPAWGDTTPNSGKFTTLSCTTALPVSSGGLGISSAPAIGAIPIGNGIGYAHNTLSAGDGISITNTAGHIEIGYTGVIAGAKSALAVTVDNGANPIVAGNKSFITIPYDCTIYGWTILANTVGSIQFEIATSTTGTFPTTTSITGATPPILLVGQVASNYVLSDWTVALTAGQILVVSVTETATVSLSTITLLLQQ